MAFNNPEQLHQFHAKVRRIRTDLRTHVHDVRCPPVQIPLHVPDSGSRSTHQQPLEAWARRTLASPTSFSLDVSMSRGSIAPGVLISSDSLAKKTSALLNTTSTQVLSRPRSQHDALAAIASQHLIPQQRQNRFTRYLEDPRRCLVDLPEHRLHWRHLVVFARLLPGPLFVICAHFDLKACKGAMLLVLVDWDSAQGQSLKPLHGMTMVHLPIDRFAKEFSRVGRVVIKTKVCFLTWSRILLHMQGFPISSIDIADIDLDQLYKGLPVPADSTCPTTLLLEVLGLPKLRSLCFSTVSPWSKFHRTLVEVRVSPIERLESLVLCRGFYFALDELRKLGCTRLTTCCISVEYTCPISTLASFLSRNCGLETLSIQSIVPEDKPTQSLDDVVVEFGHYTEDYHMMYWEEGLARLRSGLDEPHCREDVCQPLVDQRAMVNLHSLEGSPQLCAALLVGTPRKIRTLSILHLAPQEGPEYCPHGVTFYTPSQRRLEALLRTLPNMLDLVNVSLHFETSICAIALKTFCTSLPKNVERLRLLGHVGPGIKPLADVLKCLPNLKVLLLELPRPDPASKDQSARKKKTEVDESARKKTIEILARRCPSLVTVIPDPFDPFTAIAQVLREDKSRAVKEISFLPGADRRWTNPFDVFKTPVLSDRN